MRVIEGERQICPCYEEYQEFQKLAGLKDFGLEIYCHKTRTEDIRHGESVESAENTSRDVFIVHNKKGVKITTSQLTSELEKKNISCPRCRKTFEHAQELMQEVKSTERKIVIGICDHCRKKGQTIKNEFCACDEIVKKFKSIKGKQKEDIKKHVKIWLSKMRHLLKDGITLNKPKQIKYRAYSDLQIDRDLNSPAPRHEPEMQQMFHLETHKSDINLNRQTRETNLKEDCLKQGVAFFQPIKSVPTSFAHKSHESEKINTINPCTSLLGSDTSFIDTFEGVKALPRTSFKDRKLEEVFEDRPSMEAKEALKRRHDHSLRQMIRLENDSGVLFSVSKRPNVYETPKDAPWKQKDSTSKYYVESEMDINIKKLEQRNVDKFSHKTKQLDPPVAKSKNWYMKAPKPKESGLKPQFRFFFPKKMEKEEYQIQLNVSSSHLIKYTKEKFHRQAEKKRQEEENQQKLEHDQKKIARKEKKLQAEEKRRQAFEVQTKYEEEQEKLTKHKKYNKNDLRSLPVDEEEKQGKVKRNKSKEDTFEKDGGIFSESQVKGKISKESGLNQKNSKSEPENRNKIDYHFDKTKKGIKSKLEQKDKIDEQFQKAKNGLKSTPEQGNKLDKLSQKPKKDLKSKPEPEQRNKIDKVLDERKKDVKVKSELKYKGDDEIIESEKIELNDKSKQKSKDDDLISKVMKREKAKKNLKVQSEQRKKVEEKIQKIKTEEERDEKLRYEAETYKKQTAEKRKQLLKDIDEPSKNEKSTKKNNEEISAIEKDIVEIKRDKEKKMKTEEKDGDEKLQCEAETHKKQTDEKRKQLLKDIDVPSKNEKSTTKNNEEISANEKEIVEIKREKEKKMKMEEKNRDEILRKEKKEKERLNQREKLWKEKEALGKVAEKEQLSKDKGAPSETEKSTKIKQDSPGEIKVSLSAILKKITKEKTDKSVNKKEVVGLKQEITEKRQVVEKVAEKEQLSKDKGAPSETEKFTKIKQDSPGEIKVSISAILKKITKEKTDKSVNKKVIVGIKQEITEKRQEDTKDKKESKDKTSKQESQFKNLLAEHIKEKAIQKRKQLEYEAKVLKEKERTTTEQAEHKAKTVDFKMGDVKVEYLSENDHILRLIRIKQVASMKPSDIKPVVIHEHKCHHGPSLSNNCPLCYNSELELEVISLDNKINIPTESLKDIIIGENILRIKRLLEKTKEPEAVLNVYQKLFFDPPKVITPKEEPASKQSTLTKKNAQEIETEPGKGVLHYALSDRTFIEKGWTVLPTEKVVRKMNVYRMRPAHPEFDWFEHNKNKRLMTYDTGERLAEFDDNGRGRWYYRNGRLALEYYDAEETNAQQRFVIYSSGEPDERGRTHAITLLATFDYLGNGIVFDHAGKIRLKYNQTEGVVLDRSIGPVSHWKWHTLNDPPVLQQVMIDTQLPQKDPEILKLGPPPDKKTRPDNEEMLAIEFDNFIKEKSKKLSQKFKPFQIKMKALKINEHFSLRVLDQATVYLIFRDGSTNLKLNIGMILDHKEIVDTETAEVGEVSNSLEQFPARTDSLAGLQRSVAHAQRYERQHAERERRLRRPEPCVSADQLTAAASAPMRLPLRTMPTGFSSSTRYCSRKPLNNLYYNSRL